MRNYNITSAFSFAVVLFNASTAYSKSILPEKLMVIQKGNEIFLKGKLPLQCLQNDKEESLLSVTHDVIASKVNQFSPDRSDDREEDAILSEAGSLVAELKYEGPNGLSLKKCA